jgi:predicted N-formylglutamate amidohydrolase
MQHAKTITPAIVQARRQATDRPHGSRNRFGTGDVLVITCEHGGNRIPARYRHLFSAAAARTVLDTHRAYDAGALTLARDLSSTLRAPLFAANTSRLLIDLNRSAGHQHLYSEFTGDCTNEIRRDLIDNCYLPYRTSIETYIAQAVACDCRVIHLSSHSFTPVLNGDERNADIGLLYDPARRVEAMICRCWQAALRERSPDLKTRLNYPYSGKADGFTSYLRRKFTPAEYVGIEIEINQRHVAEGGRHWRAVRRAVILGLTEALAETGADKI